MKPRVIFYFAPAEEQDKAQRFVRTWNTMFEGMPVEFEAYVLSLLNDLMEQNNQIKMANRINLFKGDLEGEDAY